MTKISLTLSSFLLIFLFASCTGNSKAEEENPNKENHEKIVETKKSTTIEATKNEIKNTSTDKTPAEILVGGSWNNPNAAKSEDIIFMADGVLSWRSGNDEGSDSWAIEGKGILKMYGSDYKIVELTNTKLVVTLEGEKTTYLRNSETQEEPTFKLEGLNDTKGEYKNTDVMEAWTIHFDDSKQAFIAFLTKSINKNPEQGDAFVLEEVSKVSAGVYELKAKNGGAEKLPTWTFKYNASKKYYDLSTHTFNKKTNQWDDTFFAGSSDNG